MSQTTEEQYWKQLCVWPGTSLDGSTVEDLVNFFVEDMGVRIKYKGEVKTLPDVNENGTNIEGTGGRIDQFFYIHTDDVEKFALPRLKMGIRWWEDVIVYNDNAHMYTPEFLKENPPAW
jgi:hypothetical protein